MAICLTNLFIGILYIYNVPINKFVWQIVMIIIIVPFPHKHVCVCGEGTIIIISNEIINGTNNLEMFFCNKFYEFATLSILVV